MVLDNSTTVVYPRGKGICEVGVRSSESAESLLLHTDIFDRFPYLGLSALRRQLAARVDEVAVATTKQPEYTGDQPLSILVRTRNKRAELEGLFKDLEAQRFSAAKEVVVVDTESRDGTAELARERGATVVPIRQRNFSYPVSLNVGFEAARYPYVMTLVGHSRLSNVLALRAVSRWCGNERFGGAYGAALPDTNAFIWERMLALAMRTSKRLEAAGTIDRWQPGAMVAHRSVVNRAAWVALGGYDERYERGGEDSDFCRRLLAAGWQVVREPALSVFHSYGLTATGLLRHIRHVRQLRHAPPAPFDAALLAAYRRDLDLTDQDG